MSSWGHLLRDVVYESHVIQPGEFGTDPVWSDPAPIRCRFEDKVERITDQTGTEVTSAAQFVCETEILPAYFGTPPRIWPPGADPAKDSPASPKRIGRARSLDGRDELWQVWM